ncbi:hypothetical protein [Streptomyces fuscigenes]|uniref:hypothetical protein n=1 Tax=Streptomyces fuscigenes TaxID=1528880 RepID=UPI001F305172|nr:hypothetical protein [Streptomyces fuscigenes]MCF3963971.1 hypothetical protein [Streptomyces fuscigenes]
MARTAKQPSGGPERAPDRAVPRARAEAGEPVRLAKPGNPRDPAQRGKSANGGRPAKARKPAGAAGGGKRAGSANGRRPGTPGKQAGSAKTVARRRGGGARPPGLRRLLGRGVGVAVLVLLFLGLFGVGVQKLVYAAGWAGTAGTMKVTSCHDEGSSDASSWVCSGVYHSGDGRAVDPGARVKPPGNETGRTIDVRSMSGHDYSATGGFALVTPLALIGWGGLPLLGVLWGGRAALRRWIEDVRAARERAGRAPGRRGAPS